MRRAPRLLPALLRFPGGAARQDGWGRLLTLTSGGAELSTATPLSKHERLIVEAELGGERLTLSAEVSHVEPDCDGQTLAELRWIDPLDRRRAARALTDVLARSL